jgi:hypothetical protein
MEVQVVCVLAQEVVECRVKGSSLSAGKGDTGIRQAQVEMR